MGKFVTVWTGTTPGRLMAILSSTPELRHYATGCLDNGQLTMHASDIPILEAELTARGLRLGYV